MKVDAFLVICESKLLPASVFIVHNLHLHLHLGHLADAFVQSDL